MFEGGPSLSPGRKEKKNSARPDGPSKGGKSKENRKKKKSYATRNSVEPPLAGGEKRLLSGRKGGGLHSRRVGTRKRKAVGILVTRENRTMT